MQMFHRSGCHHAHHTAKGNGDLREGFLGERKEKRKRNELKDKQEEKEGGEERIKWRTGRGLQFFIF